MSFQLCYSSLVLVHYDTIFNYTKRILYFPQDTHTDTHTPRHFIPCTEEKVMQKWISVLQWMSPLSVASLAAQLRRCPVNEAKGCRKRTVHPVLSVPPKSAVYNDAIKHTNCSSHAQGEQSWCYLWKHNDHFLTFDEANLQCYFI